MINKNIFKTLGEVVVGTIGALFIVNAISLEIGEVSAGILIFIGIGILLMKKGLVKLIPDLGKFDNAKQDAIIGMVTGLFIADGLYEYLEIYIEANVAIVFIIGILIIVFKEQITKAIGGIYK